MWCFETLQPPHAFLDQIYNAGSGTAALSAGKAEASRWSGEPAVDKTPRGLLGADDAVVTLARAVSGPRSLTDGRIGGG